MEKKGPQTEYNLLGAPYRQKSTVRSPPRKPLRRAYLIIVTTTTTGCSVKNN